MRRWLLLLLAACDSDPVEPVAGECWAAPVTEWESVEPVDLSALEGIAPDAAALSLDGLSLFYSARTGATAPTRVFRATRAERAASFRGGDLVASWPGLDPVGRHWAVGAELFVTFDHGDGAFELAVSRQEAAGWSSPEPLGGGLAEGHANADPTATADGHRLIYVHSAMTGAIDLRLREATRNGATFEDVRDVGIPRLRAEDAVFCPTVSPDGLRLFFSTSYPHDLTSLPPNGVTVWSTERASVEEEWGEPVQVAALAGAVHSCVSGVSGDGCELWVQRFAIDGPISYVVARRQPP